jgi:hypothetical protein
MTTGAPRVTNDAMGEGHQILNLEYYLDVLEKKPGAMANSTALSPDGKSLVVVTVTPDVTTLAVFSPPGAPLVPIAGAPKVKNVNRGRLRFSHDGSKLLAVFQTIPKPESSAWRMSWPAGKEPPDHPQAARGCR